MTSLAIQRRAPAELEEAIDTAVVIDVFRATSTASVLLGRVPEVKFAATPDGLTGEPRHLVFSELGLPGAVDNSPALAGTVALDGRLPLLVTTNGTRALARAAAVARRVLVASFLDAGAVAAHLLAAGAHHVTLVPAGDVGRGERHVEDEACAEALEALLRGEVPAWEALLARCFADPRLARRIEKLPDDARVAFAVNTCAGVGELRGDRLTRVA